MLLLIQSFMYTHQKSSVAYLATVCDCPSIIIRSPHACTAGLKARGSRIWCTLFQNSLGNGLVEVLTAKVQQWIIQYINSQF